MEYRIVEGKENIELCDVVRLLRITYWAEKRPAEVIERAMQNSACFGIALEGSETLAGFARVITDHATTFYLCDVVVDPACRGRGTASRLLAEVLHEAREKSIEKCCLEVRPGNAPALRLYRGAGFGQAGLRRRYYSDGEDALVMTLELS